MNPHDEFETARTNGRVGTAMLVASFLGILLCVAGQSNLLPLPMERLFWRGPLFWLGITAALFVGGLRLLWAASHGMTTWRPSGTGRRFESAVLYTRKNCPLCDEARELLSYYRRWLPSIREIDIDIHPDFRDAFSTCVPVLELDDQIRFRGRISEVLLRRLLQGNPISDVPSNA